MKKYILVLALALAGCCTYAQTARGLLDKTAAQLQKSGIKATFEATTFQGLAEKGSTTGTLYLQGKKFKVESDGMTSWYDGKTLWTMVAGSDEVNVSTPTEQERQQLNPAAFIALYRKDGNASMTETTYAGKPAYEITVTPKASAYQRLIIVTDAQGNLKNVRFKDQNGNWLRFRISSLKSGLSLPAKTFQFSESDHPGIEIIDLR